MRQQTRSTWSREFWIYARGATFQPSSCCGPPVRPSSRAVWRSTRCSYQSVGSASHTGLWGLEARGQRPGGPLRKPLPMRWRLDGEGHRDSLGRCCQPRPGSSSQAGSPARDQTPWTLGRAERPVRLCPLSKAEDDGPQRTLSRFGAVSFCRLDPLGALAKSPVLPAAPCTSMRFSHRSAV